jgi:phospholipid transport system substrate-binding protein
MRRISWIIGFCLNLIPCFGSSVYATEGAEAVIRQATGQMYRALEQECRQDPKTPGNLFRLVDEILLPHADFERMSRWALGKYWRQASDSQLQRFVREFKVLLVRTYASMIQSVTPKDINYLPGRDAGDLDKAVVRTEVRQQGAAPLPIHYHMHRKNGRWLVYDVRIEGISLITNYRSNFAAEIRTYGIQGLIDRLKAKNRQQTVTNVEDRQTVRAGTC